MGRGRRWLVGAGAGMGALALVVVLVPGATTHAQFAVRDRLASCGAIEHDATGGGIPEEARDCLDAAWSSGAEVSVMTPTTEGDPTYAYYRAGIGRQGLEVYHDATQDAYGSGRWSRTWCPGDDVADALAHC